LLFGLLLPYGFFYRLPPVLCSFVLIQNEPKNQGEKKLLRSMPAHTPLFRQAPRALYMWIIHVKQHYHCFRNILVNSVFPETPERVRKVGKKAGCAWAKRAEAFFCLDFFGSCLYQDKKNNNRR
jgi:hypothetical protein